MTAPTYSIRLFAARQLVAAAQTVLFPSEFVDQVGAATLLVIGDACNGCAAGLGVEVTS